eukprot:m.9236 g.9236  ORF g.9236 m.9236 type:complete len:398 (-) comp4029_c0_seq1:44-1237(-)
MLKGMLLTVLFLGTCEATIPWDYTGFSRFPSFYFGADQSGPQSHTELEFVARFALSGWGWQQSYNANRGHHGESAGMNAARCLRSVSPTCNDTHDNCTSPDALFVYRQSENLFTYYDLMEAVANNSDFYSASVLHDPVTNKVCGGGGLLAFNNQTFTNYWSNVVGGEIVAEKKLGVNAVFFDGFDKLYAGDTLTTQGCPNYDSDKIASELRNKVNATKAFLETLKDGNSVAIISTYNFFENKSDNYDFIAEDKQKNVGSMNNISEEVYAEAWAGLPWVRFYEVWMGHGPEQDTAILENAIEETRLGIPFIARTATGMCHTLVYPAAAFLIAQGSHCYWGASSGWLDSNIDWHGEYSWDLGAPKAPPKRQTYYLWTREFEKGNVTVDVKNARGYISAQ